MVTTRTILTCHCLIFLNRLGLWDEASQRYYYVEEATGRTQWEFPQQEYNNAVQAINPAAANSRGMGEASSYGGSSSPYPPQQQQGYAPYGGQNQNLGDGQTGDRGIGKIFSGKYKNKFLLGIN